MNDKKLDLNLVREALATYDIANDDAQKEASQKDVRQALVNIIDTIGMKDATENPKLLAKFLFEIANRLQSYARAQALCDAQNAVSRIR